MALRRKDIKKSSYYVWFLGAKESKGIRGKDYLLPVISHLVDREKEVEPFKVTLQVSQKGLKIIQNVLSTHPKTSKPKNETIKHFIPHNTITCVYQDEDIVACILLLYNPVTKCPLHVHVYRCDSSETAGMLKSQLEILIERPENQKKYGELEVRFGKKKVDSSIGSDTGTSSHSSTSIPSLPPSHPLSSPPLSSPSTSQVLRASLAAELRARLGGSGPLLLPPKDYDTEGEHREREREHALLGREREHALVGREREHAIVGRDREGERDHRERDHREHRDSVGRERELSITGGGRDLRESTGGGLMTAMLTGKERDKRLGKTGSASSGIGSDAASPRSPSGSEQDSRSDSDDDWNLDNTESSIYLMHGSEMILPRASRHPDPSKFSPEPPKSPSYDTRHSRYPERYREDSKYEKKEMKYPEKYPDKYPEHYPEKYGEKYDKRYDRYDNGRRIEERYYEESPRYDKRFDNPRFEKNRRYDDFDEDYRQSPNRYYEEDRRRSKYYPEYPEYYQETKENKKHSRKFEDEFFDVSRRKAETRQRSPTPEVNISPKDRFKDAKEKFLLLERERLEEERIRRQEIHNSIPNLKDKSFLRRHESISHIKDERHPRPAPRQYIEDEKHRHEPLERYRIEKHRSMYNKIEDEHKIKSNEIAKELKRRSYLDNSYEFQQDPYLESFSKSNIELDKMAKSKKNAGYRHSYAEPKLSLEKMGKKYPEVVHRTNSSVSNSGRVGLASVNPY